MRFLAALSSLKKSVAGNIAITFALSTIPVIGLTGAAVDFSRANSVKVAMQAALDSTALMLARDAANLTNAQLQTKASAYFNAIFTRPEAKNIAIAASYTASGGSQVLVSGSATIDTILMVVVGQKQLTITGTAVSKWGSERLRVTLALDVTGSMASDGKMTALKSSTKNLIAQLKAAASVNGDVYISIIPFNKDINLGGSNYNASWIDWTEWNDANGSCSKDTSRTTYDNKSSCTAAGGSWTTANHNTWNGCVMDRGDVGAPNNANYDQNVVSPTSSVAASRFPAENFDSCPAAAKGLTYDWAALNNVVDSLQPVGNTNQPIGLVWAWQSLVGGGPLTAPAKDSNYQYKDIIILMSDGMNTENRWSTSQTNVDKRMYDSSRSGAGTCANAKAAGLIIYSVQVNTGRDPTSTVMKNCAGSPDKFIDPDKFWMITSAADLSSVFDTIGTNLTKLRVAK